MNPILEHINQLTEQVTHEQATLDDALFTLQAWTSRNAPLLSESDRTAFSQALAAEKSTQERDGVPYGDDQSLVASILRLHTMRLLYRYDHEHEQPDAIPAISAEENRAYQLASRKLQEAIRSSGQAINEARVDAAIANAHQLMGDSGANRRWLHDALSRLQTIANIDLRRLVEAIPLPPTPELNVLQKGLFLIFGIKPAEIARRNLDSLHQLAALQAGQIIEMAQLLATSFEAIEDSPGAIQAAALIDGLQKR